MSIDYLLLRSLHRMLRQQTDLREQIERQPRKQKLAENNQQKFQVALEEVKTTLQQTRLQANEKQLQMNSREAKIEDLKAKRNACDSNKEFKLLNDRIAADEQANSVLADEIFEMLERIDVLETELEQAKENLAKAEVETQSVAARVSAELERLNGELERVTGELKQAENRVPMEIKAEYVRLVKATGEAALSAVENATCGNCYQTQNAQTMDQLLLKKPVFCQGCGSLFYIPENSAANS